MRQLRARGVTIDLQTGALEGGRAARLSERELAVLRRLARELGQTVSREELETCVWGEHVPGGRRLAVTIGRIRKKIEVDPGQPEVLVTIHREGYRLVPDDVTPAATAPASPVAPRPSNLPDAENLVGRATMLEHISRWMASRSPWLTLVGPGGIGKSALALHHAHTVTAEIRWVDLRTVQTAEGVAGRLAEALHARLRGDVAPVRQLALAAGDGPALWILDNTEQLDEGARTLLADLADAAHQVRFLVTSREPLGLLVETVLPVPPLTEAASRELLESLDAGPTEPEQVQAVVQSAGGSPIALRLAARSLPDERAVGSITRTVEQLVQDAIDRLPPASRQVFLMLTLFAADFDPGFALRLSQGTTTDLAALEARALLSRKGTSFQLHPLVRQVGTRLRSQEDPRGRGRLRLRSELASWLADAAPIVNGAEPTELLRRLKIHTEDVLRWVRTLVRDEARWLRQTWPTLDRLIELGREPEWREALEAARSRLLRRDEPDLVGIVDLLILRSMSDVSPPDAVVSACERMDRDRLPPELQRRLDVFLALALLQIGRYDQARQVTDRAEREAREADDALALCHALRRRCDLAWLTGRWHEGIAPGQEAVAQGRRSGSALATASALRTLASACSEGGQLEACRTHLHEAAELYRKAGHRDGRASCARVLSASWRTQGDPEAALAPAEQAVALEHRGTSGDVVARYNLGIVLRMLGRYEEALQQHRIAARIAEGLGMWRLVRDLYDGTGNIEMARGGPDQALPWFEKAVEIGQRADDPRSLARVQGNLMQVLILLGRYDRAQALGERIDTAQSELAWSAWHGIHDARMAELAALTGRTDLAWKRLRASLDPILTLGNAQLTQRLLLAASLVAACSDQHALGRLLHASVPASLDTRPFRSELTRRLGPIEPESTDRTQALAALRRALDLP